MHATWVDVDLCVWEGSGCAAAEGFSPPSPLALRLPSYPYGFFSLLATLISDSTEDFPRSPKDGHEAYQAISYEIIKATSIKYVFVEIYMYTHKHIHM